jgi:hypothetical protein
MSSQQTFEELLELARRVGVTVRHVRLGGAGGGMASVRGARQLFIDLDADPEDQLQCVAHALGNLPEIDTVFIRPDVRDILDRYR